MFELQSCYFFDSDEVKEAMFTMCELSHLQLDYRVNLEYEHGLLKTFDIVVLSKIDENDTENSN